MDGIYELKWRRCLRRRPSESGVIEQVTWPLVTQIDVQLQMIIASITSVFNSFPLPFLFD